MGRRQNDVHRVRRAPGLRAPGRRVTISVHRARRVHCARGWALPAAEPGQTGGGPCQTSESSQTRRKRAPKNPIRNRTGAGTISIVPTDVPFGRTRRRTSAERHPRARRAAGVLRPPSAPQLFELFSPTNSRWHLPHATVCGFSKLCRRISLNSVASWGIWNLRYGLPPTVLVQEARGGCSGCWTDMPYGPCAMRGV